MDRSDLMRAQPVLMRVSCHISTEATAIFSNLLIKKIQHVEFYGTAEENSMGLYNSICSR